jgi:hypothetical protein
MLPLVVCFVDKRSFSIWFGQFTISARMTGHVERAERIAHDARLPSLNRVALMDERSAHERSSSFGSRFSISKRNVSFPFLFA